MTDYDGRKLRGHMANQGRLSRNRRIESPPTMRLTPRDCEIIKTVHDWRVMRSDQIQTLFFGSQSTASYRLSRLYQHGFLDRHFLPSLGGIASSPALYTLGRQGRGVLSKVYTYGPGDFRRSLGKRELSPLFLEHLLQINDVRLAITQATHANHYSLEQWRDDAQLKSDYDWVPVKRNERTLRVAVIPDSFFVLQVPQGRACCCLEVDRGSMTLARFASKVAAYQVYVASGLYEKRYQVRSLRVLVVTNSPARLKNLIRAAGQATGNPSFWFALATQVDANVLHEAIWYQVGSNQPRQLIARE